MRPPAYPRGSGQFASAHPSATRPLHRTDPSATRPANPSAGSATRPSNSSVLPNSRPTADLSAGSATRPANPRNPSATRPANPRNPSATRPADSLPGSTADRLNPSPASLVVSSASEALVGSAVGYSGFVPVVAGSGFPVGGWVSRVPDFSLVVWRSAGCVWSPVTLTGYHSVSGAVVFHVPLIDPSLPLESLVRLVSLSLGSLGLSEPLVATLVQMVRGI